MVRRNKIRGDEERRACGLDVSADMLLENQKSDENIVDGRASYPM